MYESSPGSVGERLGRAAHDAVFSERPEDLSHQRFLELLDQKLRSGPIAFGETDGRAPRYERVRAAYAYFRDRYPEEVKANELNRCILDRHRSIADRIDALNRIDFRSSEEARLRNQLSLELDRSYPQAEQARQAIARFRQIEQALSSYKQFVLKEA